MTPDKDPQNYSVLAYLAFGGSSVWGGLVTYIQTVKREGRQFAWREAVLQVVVSGFVDRGFSFSIHEGAMDKTATMLPTAQQSDSRMDEFWNSLDAGLATPEPAPRNLDVGLSDVACTVGAGGLELVGGIGELARQAGNYGRQNGGKDQGDYLENARARGGGSGCGQDGVSVGHWCSDDHRGHRFGWYRGYECQGCCAGNELR